ncbi:MAG: glycosyltransferase [Bacteroidota bacterium]
MKGISIIIPTQLENDRVYNNIQKIIEYTNGFNFEIIIVINNTDKKFDESRIIFSNLKIIYNKKGSAASARNKGAEISEKNILIFIDDDIYPVNKILWDEFLDLVIRSNGEKIYLPKWSYSNELISFCNLSTIGRFLLYYRYHEIEGYLNKNLSDELLIEHNGIASYLFPINKNLFFTLGKYNESIPYAGFEDHIISKKIYQAKIPIYIYNKHVVYHDEWNKINLRNWLNAREKNAITRQYAIREGHKELMLSYPFYKKFLYNFLLFNENIIIYFIEILSPFKIFDIILFKLIQGLLASRIYKGLKT